MTEEKRLNVRMEDRLLRQLKADAALRGITLSDLIRELAIGYLSHSSPHRARNSSFVPLTPLPKDSDK